MPIIVALLPLMLRLVGMFLDKSAENEKAKKAFIELVSTLEFGGIKSVNLNQSYRDQINARKKRIESEAGGAVKG